MLEDSNLRGRTSYGRGVPTYHVHWVSMGKVEFTTMGEADFSLDSISLESMEFSFGAADFFLDPISLKSMKFSRRAAELTYFIRKKK